MHLPSKHKALSSNLSTEKKITNAKQKKNTRKKEKK
jgi:hypothetical protein